jgi:hypothetical protein
LLPAREYQPFIHYSPPRRHAAKKQLPLDNQNSGDKLLSATVAVNCFLGFVINEAMLVI